MKKLLLAGIMLAFAPFISFAQTTATGTTATPVAPTATVEAGLVPGDFFYFLDNWGENLRLTFTFNKESKAKLHLQYAKERVAEMKDVLKKPDAKLEDIADAKKNFNVQVADAADIVKSEKERGIDVSGLARELDDELDEANQEIKDVLRGHGDGISKAEAEIRAKIESLSPSDPQIQGLTQALESITKEKGDVTKEEADLDVSSSDEQATFDEAMGKEMSAQKHIDEAVRLKARLDAMAGQLPVDVVASSQALLNQANAAGVRGDFETAKRLSKQAKKILEKAKDAVEDAEIPEVPEAPEAKDTDESTGDSDVTNLEKEIKKSEEMMDGGIEVKSADEVKINIR